ncbi:MAG: ABC transporter substrate-binding protein [Methanothrix sp.]|nr:ABC transporter substrate-binding protein [Methanothrix sp.]
MRLFSLLFAVCTWLALSAALVSSSEYTLDIFGNANLDDRIDEADVAYIEGAVKGELQPTYLSDADGDGSVTESDVEQVLKIINGSEEQIILIDDSNRTVKINMPVDSVVPLVDRDAKILGVLKAQDLAVAVSSNIKESKEYRVTLPRLTELEAVGSWTEPDLEKLLEIQPDLLIAYSSSAKAINESIGNRVAVLSFGSSTPETTRDELLKLSYVLNRRENADVYFNEFHDKYLNIIADRISELSEDDRPGVYVEASSQPYKTYNKNSVVQKLVDLAGGRHIFSDLNGSGAFATLDAEEIIKRNPDVIIKYAEKNDSGYEVIDSSKMQALRDEILGRPELAEVSAVKSSQVYVMSSYLSYGTDYPALLMYWSKWLHPDIFADMDPEAIHREYLDRFTEKDYQPNELGSFIYP